MKIRILNLFVLGIILSTLFNINAKQGLSNEIVKLDNVEYKKIEVVPSPVEGCPQKTYLPCNTSICRTDKGYMVISRTVNYETYVENNYIKYRPMDLKSVFRTKNIAIFYDKDFVKIQEKPIMDYVPKFFFKQIGLEDCRIFKWNDEYWFVGTTFDTKFNGVANIALGNLNDIETEEIIKLGELITLDSPNPSKDEKNWLPLVISNKLIMIYSYDPFILLEVEKDGSSKVIINENQAVDLSPLRGSAAPISFKDGYLLLTHQIIPPKAWPPTVDMHYYHRFIYLDSNFKIKKISDCLTFKDQVIEFVCGMTLDHSNQRLILGLGVWDRDAYLCFMDAEYVWSLLKDID